MMFAAFFSDYTGKTQAPNEYYSNLPTRLFLCVTGSLMSTRPSELD